ncbi:hypothetical protein [Salinisphaera sp. PC39]|uniref:hypothetical protein n=1 Tax=Salinisphaera sp. PC39 TaxID=1304156 RepID=UPI003341F280
MPRPRGETSPCAAPRDRGGKSAGASGADGRRRCVGRRPFVHCDACIAGPCRAGVYHGNRMSQNKLYVGNFPYDVTESQMRDLFSGYGEIEELAETGVRVVFSRLQLYESTRPTTIGVLATTVEVLPGIRATSRGAPNHP